MGAVISTTFAAELPSGESLALKTVSPLAMEADTRAVLLFFVAPDCPISNRYAPTLARIGADAAKHGIKTWLVYADDLADPGNIRTHQTNYALDLPTVIDRTFAIADFARANVTPEAALFVFRNDEQIPQLVYRGRIDDQYQGFGRYRPAATHSELTHALEQIAAGEIPAQVITKAIGCYLPRAQ